MSRNAGEQDVRVEESERASCASKGVTLISAGLDEVPMVYKNIHEVMAAQQRPGDHSGPVRSQAGKDGARTASGRKTDGNPAEGRPGGAQDGILGCRLKAQCLSEIQAGFCPGGTLRQ